MGNDLKYGNNDKNEFIVTYSKNNNNRDRKNMDLRRTVFVSLLGLFRSWRKCPNHILYSALFILPLKRKWIYKSLKSAIQRITKCIGSAISSSQIPSEYAEFIELLRWKDSQNLVFWMLDDQRYDDDDDKKLINPFWRNLSNKLCTLYDPVTKSKYKPIKFKENEYIKSKFAVSVERIFCELYFVEMKYKAIQEIIFQSNPDSLNPIIFYKQQINNNNITDIDHCDQDQDGLCVLPHYDENDIDPDLQYFDY